MALERSRTVLPPEILLEEYRRMLAEESRIEALPLVISGCSMTPFLAHRRDTVYLSRLERQPKRGDMLLYRRDTGAYVLHRVVGIFPDGSLELLGDAQIRSERVAPEHIRAVVTGLRRGEKLYDEGSLRWRFFRGPWRHIRRLRPYINRIRQIFRK